MTGIMGNGGSFEQHFAAMIEDVHLDNGLIHLLHLISLPVVPHTVCSEDSN